MTLKCELRKLKVLGCEANARSVTFHLREDTPLDPAKVLKLVARRASSWKLSPDMKLSRRFGSDEGGDSIEHVDAVLADLADLRRDRA
jgi:transcription-repair coupling factor (superfamily II helicase)